MASDPIDLLAPSAVADPHKLFRELRHRGPMVWSERHCAWLIIGHPELEAAFRDPRLTTERMATFRSRISEERANALARAMELLDGWMLFHEPPLHTRLRAPIRREFTPNAVKSLTTAIDTFCDPLLDRLAEEGSADIVTAFAHPLPANVIGHLFGLPQQLQPWLADWAARFSAVVFGAVNRADYLDISRAAGEEFHANMRLLIAERDREPNSDLLSKLLEQRQTASNAEGLTEIEIIGACSLLLFAGHDTTSSFLASAILALTRANLWDTLRDSPDEPAVHTVIEELLRFEPPAKVMMREVVEDHVQVGHGLRRGDAVFMGILGANRDPRVFVAPDVLDAIRNPNPHLSFGSGHHFCLGSALARLEARIALTKFARKFRSIEIAGEPLWKPTIADRSLATLPVRVVP